MVVPAAEGNGVWATRAGCLSGQSAAVGAGVSPLLKNLLTLLTQCDTLQAVPAKCRIVSRVSAGKPPHQGRGEKLALQRLGKNGERRDLTYGELLEAWSPVYPTRRRRSHRFVPEDTPVDPAQASPLARSLKSASRRHPVGGVSGSDRHRTRTPNKCRTHQLPGRSRSPGVEQKPQPRSQR